MSEQNSNSSVRQKHAMSQFDAVEKEQLDMSMFTPEFLKHFFENVNISNKIYAKDIHIILPSGKSIEDYKENDSQIDVKKFLGIGNKIIETMVFMLASPDQRAQMTIEEFDDDEEEEIDLFEQKKHVCLSFVVFLLSDQTKSETDEQFLPRIVKNIHKMNKLKSLNEKITNIDDLRPIYEVWIKQINFENFPRIIRSRLLLGIAGHRYVSAYVKISIEKKVKFENESDHRKFHEMLLEIEKNKPCMALHSGFKSLELESAGSLNRVILSFVSELGLCSADFFIEKIMRIENANIEVMKLNEMNEHIGKFLDLKDQILSSSKRKSLIGKM